VVVTELSNKFRNVIFCEDIRDEVGNKKSLMGAIAGDVFVPAFPATIKIAIYFEYAPEPIERNQHLSIEFRLLQNDDEIAKGGMEATVQPNQSANFILPMALVTFEKEATFRMRAAVNGGPEQELLTKKISKPSVTS
jgi:hypothetical protein